MFNYYKKLLALILLFFLSFTYNVNAAIAPEPTITKSYSNSLDTHTFQTRLVINNQSNHTLNNIKVNFALLGIDNSFQTILNESFTHQPTDIIDDIFNSRIATFTINSLEQNKTETIIVNYTVKVNGNNTNYTIHNQAQYLEPSNKVESKHPLIMAKAATLTTNIENDMEKAEAIYQFVRDYLKYDLKSAYRNKGALSALNTKEGVCEEYASLFVALCRASGIPARVVNGFADPKADGKLWSISSSETLSLNSYRHSWAEFYIDGVGWLPADPTYDSINKGMRYFGQIPTPSHIAQNYHDLPLKISYQGPREIPLEIKWHNEMVFEGI